MISLGHRNTYIAERLTRFLLLGVLLCASNRTVAQLPRKSFIPRTIDWGYRIIEGDSAHPRKRYIFPFPIIAYRPESRWIGGISVTHIFKTENHDGFTRPSLIRLNISYSQQKQFAVKPAFEYFSKANKYNLRGFFNYTDFGEYYWGVGANTPDVNKEMYSFNMIRMNTKVAKLVARHLYAGVQYSMEEMYNVKYQSGSGLESSSVAGKNGYLASGAGFTVYYDDREHVYFPIKGQIIELSNVFYSKAFGSEYNFWNVTADARKYIGLWKENVVALQGFANLNFGNIPFRMMGVIGSENFMRGYYNGRYRDNHAMAFQAELRKTIWGPIGCVVFAGFGTVNSTVDGLTTNIKPNLGAGLRVKAIPSQRVNVRVDYGIGSDGNKAFYVTMNEAF